MDTTDLDVIDKEAGYEIKEKFNRMVLSWLKTTGPCTWKVLYKALKHPIVNMPDVAQEIRSIWWKNDLQAFFGELLMDFMFYFGGMGGIHKSYKVVDKKILTLTDFG